LRFLRKFGIFLLKCEGKRASITEIELLHDKFVEIRKKELPFPTVSKISKGSEALYGLF
jgi:hypothetical protein